MFPAARVVFGAKPPCARLDGAAIDRAGFVRTVCRAEFLRAGINTGFVRAADHYAHLFLLLSSSPLLSRK